MIKLCVVFAYIHSLSAHILFDHAMEMNEDEEFVPNTFVKLLVSVVADAAR